MGSLILGWFTVLSETYVSVWHVVVIVAVLFQSVLSLPFKIDILVLRQSSDCHKASETTIFKYELRNMFCYCWVNIHPIKLMTKQNHLHHHNHHHHHHHHQKQQQQQQQQQQLNQNACIFDVLWCALWLIDYPNPLWLQLLNTDLN